MTAHRDLKTIVRNRQQKTGESYTSARARVLQARAKLQSAESPAAASLEAVVLKVNRVSARVRILGEEEQWTFRAGNAWAVVPGHIVTLVVKKRWTWRGDAYASGKLESPRIDVTKLGLDPLPLEDGGLSDVRSLYEPFRDPDPYAPLWRQLTAKPRACFQMDPIAWGAFPGADPDESPVGEAVELVRRGAADAARELLMETLLRDLRCIDAHTHLGNLEFDRSPERAIVHYEVGVRIGELSLGHGFEGVLAWGELYNRPFLRCLKGYGLCLWRLGRSPEALRVFERILALNPNDNQGARFCWEDLRHGRSWDELDMREQAGGDGGHGFAGPRSAL